MDNSFLLTVDDVAKALKLSSRTVWKYCKEGSLPTARIGRAVRIRPSDLEAFIAERCNVAHTAEATGV